MISIINTIPEANADGLYIDVPIHLEFDTEISDTSLATLIFNLYKQTPKAGGGYTYNAIGTNIHKDAGNPNIVVIDPLIALDKNQEYMIMVLGDRNISDGTPQGILSTTGDVMDGNFLMTFTTGTEKAPVPDTEPVITSDTDFESDTQTNNDTDNTDTGQLEVIGVEPVNLFDIVKLGELIVEFNEAIEISTIKPYVVDGFNIDHEGSYIPMEITNMSVEENMLKFKVKGFECISGEYKPIEDSIISGELNGESPLPINHKYKVSILRSKVKGKGSNTLLKENADVEITTKLFPVFASAYEVKTKSRGLIKNNISDELITITIRDATKFILDRIQWQYGPCLSLRPIDKLLYSYIKQYVICKSIYDLIGIQNQDSGGIPRQISSKSLGDFSIKLNSNNSSENAKSLVEQIQDCIDDNFSLIMAYLGQTTRAATKSINTTYYPGRRRTKGMRYE